MTIRGKRALYINQKTSKLRPRHRIPYAFRDALITGGLTSKGKI